MLTHHIESGLLDIEKAAVRVESSRNKPRRKNVQMFQQTGRDRSVSRGIYFHAAPLVGIIMCSFAPAEVDARQVSISCLISLP